jgi:hypothetical protein
MLPSLSIGKTNRNARGTSSGVLLMKVYLVDGWRTSAEYVISLPISLLSGKKGCGATYLGGISEAVRMARKEYGSQISLCSMA